MSPSDLFNLAALAIGSGGILLGFRIFHPTKPFQLGLALADVGLLAFGIIALGPLGIGIFSAAAALALAGHIVHSAIALALRLDRILAYAAINAGCEHPEMKSLHKRLLHTPATQDAFLSLGNVETAELLSQLAQRGRSVNEIEQLARPIAMALATHELAMASFVEKIDRLLRLYGEPASQTMRVMDVLTKGAQDSAATFEEMLDASIKAVDFVA